MKVRLLVSFVVGILACPFCVLYSESPPKSLGVDRVLPEEFQDLRMGMSIEDFRQLRPEAHEDSWWTDPSGMSPISYVEESAKLSPWTLAKYSFF